MTEEQLAEEEPQRVTLEGFMAAIRTGELQRGSTPRSPRRPRRDKGVVTMLDEYRSKKRKKK